MGWVRSKLVEVFGADLRSLAVFRMALGVMVLVDLAYRATDLPVFYADGGVLPRSVLLQDESLLERWRFSLNLLSGEPFFQSLLFGATAMAALALLFGYSTRLMTIIVWMMMVSIQWRNPLVLNEGDTLLRVLLFWSIFLPLGAYWSADRASEAARSRFSPRFLSFATAGLFLQISFVYWFTAILKSGPDWRVDGTAIYYALSVDEWVTLLGAFLYQFPTLLTALTFATIALEGFGPFLLFSPVFTGPVSTGAALAFMGLHFGIWMTMPIGLFSWIAALCMVCFLPSWFWDKALPKLRAMLPKRLRDAPRPLRASWSSLRGRLSSVSGMGGVLSAAGVTANGGDHSYGSAITDTAVGEETRRGVAGRAEPSVLLRPSPVTNVLAALTLIYVFSSNLTTVSGLTIPERVAPIGLALSLDQGWSVFAPGVTRYNDWYIIPGTLQNGQQINLIPAALHNDYGSREEVSWEKPPDVSGDLKNKYWRKYLSSLRADSGEPLRPYFGRYVCREWNARHTGDEQLVDLQLGIVEEMTLPDYQRAEPESTVLLEHTCA